MIVPVKIVVLTTGTPRGWTTVGTWYFERPKNQGKLIIEACNLRDWRYMTALVGHELIEAIYCKMFGKTTEECDRFDEWMEGEYTAGREDVNVEQGYHHLCPYRVGHVMGAIWERIVIHGTFASWKKYNENCNQVMGLA